jgi:8-oxo-dGTP diphosphatase
VKVFTDHAQWMESLTKRISSGAVLLENSSNELLIIKNNNKGYWSLPGGIVDPGETPRQAAIREVSEEVGITLIPDQVEFVAVIDRISDEAQTYQFIFRSTVPIDESQIVLQVKEIDEHTFVSREQILSNDRHYGKVLTAWANGQTGYVEQNFGRD